MSLPVPLAKLKRRVKSGVVRAKDAGPVSTALVDSVESIDEERRTAIFVMSDATADHVGDCLHPEGARLATFQRNPQFLWAHDQEQLPIGTWLRVWVEDSKLKGEVQFATADLDAGGDVTKSFAEACWRMTKAGMLNAVSVFFVIHDAEFNGDGLDVTDWELLECSLVTVGMNPNALRDGKALALGLKSFAAHLESRMPDAKAMTETDAGAGGEAAQKPDAKPPAAEDHAKAMSECVKSLQGLQATQSKMLADHSKLMAQQSDLIGAHTKSVGDADAHATKVAALFDDLSEMLAGPDDDEPAPEGETAPAKAARLDRIARAKSARVLSEKNFGRLKAAIGHVQAVVDDHVATHGEPEAKDDGGEGEAKRAPDFATWFKSLTPEQLKAAASDLAAKELARARGRLD
jgi:hypothetical protein